MTEFRRNTRNIGSYLIGPTLGEGAFGKVKLGTHIHTGEKVAIKILDKQKMQEDPDDIVRVQSEIAVLKKMRHKNIIQLYEIMESSRNIYLILEYCEEKELFDYINSRKRLTEAEALRFFQEIIDALDYLHCQNIVHRDLKPENLMLDYKHCLKLSDFGLSRTYTNDKLLSTPCGTPSYAPPEMLNGEEYHGLLSDIWSAGVILYAMLSGYLPFDESNEEINCQNIIRGEFDIPDWISDSAADLIKCILIPDPYYRYDLDQIKSHPWFNWTAPYLRPGVIIGYHKIPVDENILEEVEKYGYNKLKTKENIISNKFCMMTSIYYLILRKFIKEGGTSISDLESEEYIRFIQDEGNLIEVINEENSRAIDNSENLNEKDNENEENYEMREADYSNKVDKMSDSKIPQTITEKLSKEELFKTRRDTKDLSQKIIQSEREKENGIIGTKINSSNNNADKINSQRSSLSNTNNNKECSVPSVAPITRRKESIKEKSKPNSLPFTSRRSVTIEENYIKRFINRRSLFIHDDLEKFFKLNRCKRNSANYGIKSNILENIPRVSYLINKYRRNTYGNDEYKCTDKKLFEILKINSNIRNDSLKHEFGNLSEFQSKQRNSLNSANGMNANETFENLNQLEISNNNKDSEDIDSDTSDSNVYDSAETVNSRKKSILNNNTNILSDDTPSNKIDKFSIKYNKAKTQAKTDSKKINPFATDRLCQNFNVSFFNKTRTNKLRKTSRSKFILKSKSLTKYKVDNLKPKIIFKRKKLLTQSVSKLSTIQYPNLTKKKETISSNKVNLKTLSDKCEIVYDRQKYLNEKEEFYTHRNKFIKGATFLKNDTSVEKSRSKTPCRNLSYSSYYAKKSKKDRVDDLPWNIKKKIIEVENLNSENKNNINLDAIKGIIERYEKFKKTHCNLKNTKNKGLKKNIVKKVNFNCEKNSIEPKIINSENPNEISFQDIKSSPKEAELNILNSGNDKYVSIENKKSSCIRENTNTSKNKHTPNIIKNFVCFEDQYETAKTKRKNSQQLISSHNKTISTTQFKTEKLSNKASPFRQNLSTKETVFYTANHKRELFYKKTKIEFETKYKKSQQKFNSEKNSQLDINYDKLNSINNKIFAVEDNNVKHLKTSYGPIDISSIVHCVDINATIEKLKEVLKRKKITYVRINPYKYKCSKNGICFEIKIQKMEDVENMFSVNYRMFQGGQENFRKLSQAIMIEIY